MIFFKYFLTFFLFATGFCFADAVDSSDVAKAKISSDAATLPESANMVGGYNSKLDGGYGISERNQMYAKISYVISLIFCAGTLVVFFIARINAKKNYVKAKKFLMIGLALFAIAIATFLLPKMFLSTTFPGNYDIRAT
tara:strand:+ start:43959 stop:44375 length:417 start_codon:yes stop_codon:yes gene_type:complete